MMGLLTLVASCAYREPDSAIAALSISEFRDGGRPIILTGPAQFHFVGARTLEGWARFAYEVNGASRHVSVYLRVGLQKGPSGEVVGAIPASVAVELRAWPSAWCSSEGPCVEREVHGRKLSAAAARVVPFNYREGWPTGLAVAFEVSQTELGSIAGDCERRPDHDGCGVPAHVAQSIRGVLFTQREIDVAALRGLGAPIWVQEFDPAAALESPDGVLAVDPSPPFPRW